MQRSIFKNAKHLRSDSKLRKHCGKAQYSLATDILCSFFNNRAKCHEYFKHISIAILFSLSLVACGNPSDSPVFIKPAMVMVITEKSLNQGMTLAGEVKPRYESMQGFRVNGKIVEREVEIGSLVKRGQLLAKLDKTDANLALQSSNADLKIAEAQFLLAKANFVRQQELMEKNFISVTAMDSVEAEYKAAKAKLQKARTQIALNSNQSRYTLLTAERDGVITAIRAEPGQIVVAGEVIANIADLRQLEVHISVPESSMRSIQLNESATMWLWAKRDKKYEVRIREISPLADPVTRSFLVKLSIMQPDQDVHLGMTAEVELYKNMNQQFLVPSTAVTKIQGKSSVWLVDEETHEVKPHTVEISGYREDGVLISKGLRIGDTVVTVGVQNLIVGLKVRPVNNEVNP